MILPCLPDSDAESARVVASADPADRFYTRFFRITGLNILSNIVVPLASLVDTAMLGHLEDVRYLSGAALAGILFNYVYWTFGFLRMSTTGETAQAVGRGDRTGEYGVLYRGGITAAGIALVIVLLQGPIADAGFSLLAGEEGVKAAGREYFFARILGAPAAFLNFVLLGWFLGREQSHIALAMTFTNNVANVALNYWFIMVLGWAAYGAGLATALAQYAMLVVGLLLFFAQGRPVYIPLAQVLHRAQLLRLFSLNRDIMIRTFVLISAFSLFTNYSSVLGKAVLASNAVILKFIELAAYLIDGAAFASETFAGMFRGARDRPGFRKLVRVAMASGLVFAAAFLIPLLAVPELVFGFMTNSTELLDAMLTDAVWCLPILVFGAVAFVYDGIFIGLSQGRALRNAMLISFFGGFLPLAYLGLMYRENDLLWLSMAGFMLVRALTLHVAMRWVYRDFDEAAAPPSN